MAKMCNKMSKINQCQLSPAIPPKIGSSFPANGSLAILLPHLAHSSNKCAVIIIFLYSHVSLLILHTNMPSTQVTKLFFSRDKHTTEFYCNYPKLLYDHQWRYTLWTHTIVNMEPYISTNLVTLLLFFLFFFYTVVPLFCSKAGQRVEHAADEGPIEND